MNPPTIFGSHDEQTLIQLADVAADGPLTLAVACFFGGRHD